MMEDNTNTNVNVDTENNNEQTEQVAFTDEQKAAIAKLIQAESDRRTNQALDKQKKAYEKKLSLASLDGAERDKAEATQKIAELQEQLAAFQVEKNKSELKSVLSSRGLSAEFADLIQITDNIEESQSRIDALDKLFKQSVKNEVEKRLASNSPKANVSVNKTYTKEDAAKMGLDEMMALKNTNPELYKTLFN